VQYKYIEYFKKRKENSHGIQPIVKRNRLQIVIDGRGFYEDFCSGG